MSAVPIRIIGSFLSPYVRKVLVCLDMKGIPYQIDPIVPFYGDEQFAKISPVRRIPVLIDGDVVLSDSTVICEYLEERTPSPSLYPATPPERGRARWLEEFADTRMGEVFIWRYFNEIVIKRFVWGEATDAAVVQNTVEVEIPQVLDYLEGEIPAAGSWIFGEVGVADISIASFFRNAAFAGFAIDSQRWPRCAALVGRTLDHPSFGKLRQFEELAMKTPIPRQREALAAIGAPLTPMTFGTSSARRGVLST
jgi:glutathione S-transferase